MDAMEQIYLEHAKTVYGFLLSRTHNSDLAEELTQETFFQAVRGIDKLREIAISQHGSAQSQRIYGGNICESKPNRRPCLMQIASRRRLQ